MNQMSADSGIPIRFKSFGARSSSLRHEQITDHCLDFGFEDHDDRG